MARAMTLRSKVPLCCMALLADLLLLSGGLNYFQKGDMIPAIISWEKVRCHLMRERGVASPWHSRAMAVLCSHLALALARHLDTKPQRTRGSEAYEIQQGKMRPGMPHSVCRRAILSTSHLQSASPSAK